MRLSGTSSMAIINQALKQRYEEKFPDAKIELVAGDTSKVLEALQKGETDLVAVGRRLTSQEKDQGLVEVPINRGKIAIIVGSDNPFQENLSFEQFAKIFRGEITSWSEVGGPKVPIRFIDRPESSDTKQALKNYDVFKKAPFQTGGKRTQVSEDDTAAVVKELGKDGISYAIANQVLDKENVQIVQMHKTLPNDPRYPYSQPRTYVYKKDSAPPEVLAFLGLVTSKTGQEVVAALDKKRLAAITSGELITSPSPDTTTETAGEIQKVDSADSDLVVGAPNPNSSGVNEGNSSEVTASPSPDLLVSAPNPNTSRINETNSSEVTASPSPDTTTETALLRAPLNDAREETEIGGFPWWLLLLLGIPLLGALIWGLRRGREGESVEIGTTTDSDYTPVGGNSMATGVSEALATPTPQTQTATPVDGNENLTQAVGISAPETETQTAIAPTTPVDVNEAVVETTTPETETETQVNGNETLTQPIGISTAPETDIETQVNENENLTQAIGISAPETDIETQVNENENLTQAIGISAPEVVETTTPETDIKTQVDVNKNLTQAVGISAPEVETETAIPQTTPVDGNEAVVETTTPETETQVNENENLTQPVGISTAKVVETKTPETDIEIQVNGNETLTQPVGSSTAETETAIPQTTLVDENEVVETKTPETETEILIPQTTPVDENETLTQPVGISTAEEVVETKTPETDIETQVNQNENLTQAVGISAPETETETAIPQTTPVDANEVVQTKTPETDIETAIAPTTLVDGNETLTQPIGISTAPEVVETKTPETETETAIPQTTPVDKNETAIDTRGIALTPIAAAAGLAWLVAAWATRKVNSEITLTPQVNQSASATWEVPQTDKDAAKSHGGQQYQLRVYDVTDIDLDSQAPHKIRYYYSEESNQQWQVGNLLSDRDYQAEIGYTTDDGEWLKLARSNRVRILEDYYIEAEKETELVERPKVKWASSPCNITITPDDAENMMVVWEVPQTAKNTAKEQGGEEYQLRVYDVTDIDLDTQPAYNVQAYDCQESTQQLQVPVLLEDRDYQAEIGYVTDDGDWLKLARSNRIWMPVAIILETTEKLKSTKPDATPPTIDIPEEALNSSWITIVPRDGQSACAHWKVSQIAKDTANQLGGKQYQLRILDVTDIDPDSQQPHNIQQYNCDESTRKQEIPIKIRPVGYVDYLAEIGYITDKQWLRIASSNPLRMPVFTQVDDVEAAGKYVSGAAAIGASAASQLLGSKQEKAIVTSKINRGSGNCEIQHLVVHSRKNCHLLNEEQMRGIQETAVSKTLEPGIYIVRIKSGTFGYGSNICPSGEPFVMFWIYGGKVKNKKTKVPVAQTWSTLNGYHETLTLEVLETVTLCAFFFDTYPDDNEGELTVSVARLYS
ncbi:MAG: DUF4912 domain-containing protein [Microcoleaceae cyanobacterium]